MDSFDEKGFRERVDRIDAFNDNKLVLHFKDGTTKEVTWDSPSRRDSWTDEMKQKARERSLNYGKR